MFKEIYNDSSVRVIAIVENSILYGINVTFHSVLARRLYWKTNGSMFVYKGRWFKGIVEKDYENTLYIDIERYGYIIVDGDDIIYKQITDFNRL